MIPSGRRMRSPAPTVLLRTGDTLVRDAGDVLLFTRRGAFQLGLGAAVLGLGAGFLGLRALTGPDALYTWAGWLLVVLGALNLLLGAARGLASPVRLDGVRRELVVGERRIPFTALGPPQLVETQLAGNVAVSLTLAAPGAPLRLIDGQLARERHALEVVAKRVAQLLAPDAPPATHLSVETGHGFKVALLLALGLTWAASAGWLAPDLVLAPPGGPVGARMWPLGLWIAALGLLELLGARVFDALVGPWTARRGLLFAAWFGSYLLVAGVRL